MKKLLLLSSLALTASSWAGPYVQASGRIGAFAGGFGLFFPSDSGQSTIGFGHILIGGSAARNSGATGHSELAVTSRFGFLSGSALGSAFSSNGEGGKGWCDNQVAGAPDGVSEDTILVTSSTLALGTVIDFQVSYKFSGLAHFVAGGAGTDSFAVAQAEFDCDPVGEGTHSFSTGVGVADGGTIYNPSNHTEVLHAIVGQTIEFRSELWLLGQAQSSTSGATDSSSYIIDAATHAYLDALTPGVGFRSESGHNYSSGSGSVPGPAATLAFGLGLVGRMRRRRANIQSRRQIG